jgi:hypothetical protein
MEQHAGMPNTELSRACRGIVASTREARGAARLPPIVLELMRRSAKMGIGSVKFTPSDLGHSSTTFKRVAASLKEQGCKVTYIAMADGRPDYLIVDWEKKL